MGSCTGYSAAYLACQNFVACRGYYAESSLGVGEILYADSCLTTPVVGNDSWYWLSLQGVQQPAAYFVNNSGVIINVENC